jgi:hypothetical protein
MRTMQVKESNDRFMFGAIIDSGIWILYANSKYGSVRIKTSDPKEYWKLLHKARNRRQI